MELGNKKLDETDSMEIMNELLLSQEYTEEEIIELKKVLQTALNNSDFITKKKRKE